MEAVIQGAFGQMVSARGVAPACQLSLVSLAEAVGTLKTVDIERYYDTTRYSPKL